jgi:putative ABC transport system substrate-binding protein
MAGRMTFGIGRRQFTTLLGGAAALPLTRPLAVYGQQPAMPVVGFLTSLGRDDRPNLFEAARRGLSEAGFVDGRNVTIEYRFAENQIDRLPALAADLVDRKAAVILAAGGGNSVLAAMASSTTIPIVFLTGGDPVQQGFVGSLNRPGGNVTGVNWFGSQLAGKGLGLLHELIPGAAVIGLLTNPTLPEAGRMQSDAQEAARTLGRELRVLDARDPSEIDAAFASLRQRPVGALLVSSNPFFSSRRQQIVALAAGDAIPAMYFNREFVADGGLMSYGNDIADAYRRAGVYVGRILNGAKPADLPVDQATKFEFVINLKTAKRLGIVVPPGLSASADEVIE